jgi:hypothetical protein
MTIIGSRLAPALFKSLVGKSARQSAVSHESDDVVVLIPERSGTGHPKRDGDRVGGMTGDKSVVDAFARLWKAGDAAEGAQRSKLLHASRQNFMHIGLVPHVEHQPVAACVEDLLDGERRLDDAEIGRQMAAGLCERAAPEIPGFPRRAADPVLW